MQSPFNRPLLPLTAGPTLEVPDFLRPVAVGRISSQLVGLKLSITPGNHRLETWAMRVAMGLETEAGLKYMHSTVLQQ